MGETGDVAIDIPDDAVEEALTDHHLDEVAGMIQRARADEPSSESPVSDIPAGHVRGSSTPSVSARLWASRRRVRPVGDT